jgi:hypothetical protein
MLNLPERPSNNRAGNAQIGIWDLSVADEAALAAYIVTAEDIARQPVIFAAAEKTLWVPSIVGSPGTFVKLSGSGGSGSGDVVGPSSATDNALARFDATTGKLIQNSLVTVDDAGNIGLPASRTVDGRDVSVDGTKLDGVATGADVTGANPPQAHAASHKSGGTDAIKLNELAAPTASVGFNGQAQTGTQAGTSGATTSTAPLGAASGSVQDQAITHGVADLNADLAIAANTSVDCRILATITDTTDSSKKRRIRARVLVVRGSGAPTIEEVTEFKTNDDNSSIYSADIEPTVTPLTCLYGKLSISGNNLRVTVTKHTTDDQKATVNFFPFVTPDPV